MFLFNKEFNASFKRDRTESIYFRFLVFFFLDKVHVGKLILLVTKYIHSTRNSGVKLL